MRALISLYHQAESFISPENLSDAIDTAFIDKSRGRAKREMNLNDLLRTAQARHRRPKVSIGGNIRLTARFATLEPELEQAQSWSNMEPQRQHQVRGALFGTEGIGKPGLGVLEDEYDRVMQELTRDQRDAQKRLEKPLSQ